MSGDAAFAVALSSLALESTWVKAEQGEVSLRNKAGLSATKTSGRAFRLTRCKGKRNGESRLGSGRGLRRDRCRSLVSIVRFHLVGCASITRGRSRLTDSGCEHIVKLVLRSEVEGCQ